MRAQRLKIYNGKVITPNGIIPQGVVVVKEGIIEGIEEGNIQVPDALEIDAKGAYISPGFIDIHVHGGGGHDFMDGTVEAFLEIAKIHAR
ncbi:MAG: N-acetylglucosamine-6-phosphate deacetylase, partial [Adhaeribacter sp.]|nr:N-acetylglucosamine-6-phosphate deacetylase [Adhaeribacter sp.]